jgi:hypothetical protein
MDPDVHGSNQFKIQNEKVEAKAALNPVIALEGKAKVYSRRRLPYIDWSLAGVFP